ncbi:hypothetical protein [Streptomyces melanogenes]|uniref:hypothetical protein n=1 Tax=Streptomyces melanogenes TaxID=67326 RepID=UPI00167C579A|nr:hypothetical protein [Streptomyces melanogenes]
MIAAAVSTSMLLHPAPAVAGQTGIQKCLNGRQPDVSVPFTQLGGGNDGFPGGPNPPNGIFPGNALHVVVNESAKVSISNWNTEFYGIDGKNEAATSGYPFPGWKKYANFFRMNNNPGGWVASGNDSNPWNPHFLRELNIERCWAAPALPVRMGVGMNDDNIGDNSGSWRWTLQIWRND